MMARIPIAKSPHSYRGIVDTIPPGRARTAPSITPWRSGEQRFAAKPRYAVSQAATTSRIEQASVAIAINSNLPMTAAILRQYDVSSSRKCLKPLTLGVGHINASVVAIDRNIVFLIRTFRFGSAGAGRKQIFGGGGASQRASGRNPRA